MPKYLCTPILLLLSLTCSAQSIDLVHVTPSDSVVVAARHYSDSITHTSHPIYRWGKGDSRFSFPTLDLRLSVGRSAGVYWDDQLFYNTSLSLHYHPFQFSTYASYRPCFFGGGIGLGASVQVQPERGIIDRQLYSLNVWQAHGTFSFPLAFTVRIANADTHQLSVGFEPEVAIGAEGPTMPGDSSWDFSLQYSFRAIIQYRYDHWFFHIRPSVGYNLYGFSNPHFCLGVGYNF